ncbi:MAG: hypothetical protein FWC19_02160 [Treponema sp.]|nr:hypothetical protein [Treponema sp.]
MITRKIIFFLCLIPLSVFFLTCGIEEYYYLPQVNEGDITLILNTEAIIDLPPIPDIYYFASGYIIFYRIYISTEYVTSSTAMNQISSALVSDYNAFSQFTNPANTSSIISLNTFRNRNYFELEFYGGEIASILPKTGGTLYIRFPVVTGGYPIVTIDDGQEIQLRRSRKLISPQPIENLSFQNTYELRLPENSNININADVAGHQDGQYAYVSMYIAAIGTNPSNFTPVYSKPTHIGVFILPEA